MDHGDTTGVEGQFHRSPRQIRDNELDAKPIRRKNPRLIRGASAKADRTVRLVIVPPTTQGATDMRRASESFTRTIARIIAAQVLEEHGQVDAAAKIRKEATG
jgi:hypothetical protein